MEMSTINHQAASSSVVDQSLYNQIQVQQRESENKHSNRRRRSVLNKRNKRKQKRQYSGRKERLRARNGELLNELSDSRATANADRERSSALSKQNAALKRKLLLIKTQQSSSLLRTQKSSCSCRTRASNVQQGLFSQRYSLDNVRIFSKEDVSIDKKSCLGQGAFGRCYSGTMGPLSVCIKVIRTDSISETYFSREVSILLQCCHTNLPILYGIVTKGGTARYNMIVMSFHGVGKKSCTLHSTLCKSKACQIDTKAPDLSRSQWRIILHGLMSAVHYLHRKNIIHNDIKSDNILIEECESGVRSILIDLGKACFIEDGKKYNLSNEERRLYRVKHPQVAPDLCDGIQSQCTATDMYSVGRIVSEIHRLCLPLPILKSLGEMCLEYASSKRPTSDDMLVTMTSLLPE